MDITMIFIEDLMPYENNAKIHDDKHVRELARSIKRYGFRQPILIDCNNVIVVGHGRWMGAKKAGLKQVPCVYADGMTEEEIREYRLIDNKLNESPWDFDLLAAELDGLDFVELDLDWGVEDESEAENEEKKRKAVKFHEKISVVVDCADDEQAEELYNQLSEEGYTCRISTL